MDLLSHLAVDLNQRIQQRTTLRQRLCLIVLLAFCSGMFIDAFLLEGTRFRASWLGSGFVFAGMLTVLGLNLLWAFRSVARPIEGLAKNLEQLASGGADELLGRLPTGRADKLGQIARSSQQLRLASIRSEQEHRQLRREIDTRVARRTRTATAKLRRLALRDPLTDLGNRRFVDRQMAAVVKQSLQRGCPVVCLAMDLDRFKQINDTLGHATGDRVLRVMAGVIEQETRQEDLAARPGGDEFLLIMIGANRAAGQRKARLIRQRFREAVGPEVCDARLWPDVAVGLACSEDAAFGSLAALHESADRDLYAVKRRRHSEEADDTLPRAA